MQENKQLTLMPVLNFTVLGMLLLESIDELPTEVNKFNNKRLLKELLKSLEPTVENYYERIFGIEEGGTQDILFEYSRQVSRIASMPNIPDKISANQMDEAYVLEPHTMRATASRIIKKHSK